MADAPKLLGTDTLRNAYPKLNSAIDNANEALAKSANAETNSVNAVNTANTAESKADSVQEQFNQVVIDGDSSIEAAQARVKSDGTSFITLRDRLNDTDSSLDQKAKKTDLLSNENYRGGIFTIIDDDSYATFMSRFKPIADAQGIKLSVAVNTSWVGTPDKMTLAQLKQLKSEGYDILSHGYTHPDMNTMSLADLENEWNLSRQYLIANDLGDDLALVYPVGLSSITDANKAISVKTLTRKYYKYGIDALASTKAINTYPVDNYEVLRMFVNPATVTLTYLKPFIDDAYTRHKWLILLTHCGTQWDDTNSPTNWNAIIDYVQSLGMPIRNFRESEKLVGNVMSHGDSRTANFNFISKTGASWQRNNRDLVQPMSVSSMDALIDEYEKYKTFTQQISNTQDTYLSTGGVLVTYRGDNMFSYQLYYPAQRQTVYKRTYNDSTGVWGAWSLPIGAATAEAPITLVNGWTGTLIYSKDGLNRVTLKGSLTVGTNSSTIVGNIPSGNRPPYTLGVSVYVKSGTKANTVIFPFALNASTGNLITTAANGLATGDTVEFVATYQS
jgi:peptidoglycan/xylan/chitin deacetylase (PgdA/CDA1 family)